MKAAIFALPGNETLAAALADRLQLEPGAMTLRSFPDGETYLRFDTPVSGRPVLLFCSLHDPDRKTLGLLFAAATARELGATAVGLVAPYLGYMRQDHRFRDGEAITSAIFAQLLSRHIDWLVTSDPHLHRWKSLDEIYAVPSTVVPAAPLLAAWIRRHVDSPVLIGPDAESEQWVSAVAHMASAPHVILQKVRRGDRDVIVRISDPQLLRNRTPVLVDDIISTASTMIAAIQQLSVHGLRPPVCLGVHAVFAGDAHAELLAAGAAQIVTTNTIPHASNGIDINDAIANAVAAFLSEKS
ncbi:MAG: ribose-phosphate pyrophosphokinase [Proteobacteria bacterium]|nr:ribose-phosphate pyrophosphokinase [Pseudomonadota bacterium]